MSTVAWGVTVFRGMVLVLGRYEAASAALAPRERRVDRGL